MTGLFTLMARAIMLHKHSSTVPTSIMPLDQIHKACIFLDDNEASSEEVGRNAAKFFSGYGIELTILCPKKWEIAWWGGLKSAYANDEDLFISLAGVENYTGKYVARCSRAKFKIGRFDMGDVFNVIVTNSDDTLPKQSDIFQTVRDILSKIQ